MKKIYLTILFFYAVTLVAQNKYARLDSIVISASRIDIPILKNSRTIKVITAEEIKNSPASNLNELLQEISGIDIRQRGVSGMQADIYIRGGNFEQTLLLIDGIKVEDPQTGHHTLNMILPLEIVERIEIMKGPASRVYGQNAFSGAINIITKDPVKDQISIRANYGSFNHFAGSFSASKKFKKSNHIIHYSNNSSDGYRDNTDFKNSNYFLKSTFDAKIPVTLLASFEERKFGANNFYTNSPNYNEYEETQASLVGVSTKMTYHNWIIKPKLFWKRNQDMFLLKRENPGFSRNFNVSNKIGASVNTSYASKYGISGFGVEFAKTTLSSNNLGNQNRTSVESFVEHRFLIWNDKIDITPGVSFNYFSDFGNSFMPGVDFGYQANDKLRLYWDIGKSYRVPSYTELYVNIPNFLSGNPKLKPEEAYAQEIGLKYHNQNFYFNLALFNRNSKNLIDYIKETSSSTVYIAKNLRQIITNGFEINSNYRFKINELNQKVSLSYTYLDDNYKDIDVFASRYLINTTIRHHFIVNWKSQFTKYVSQSLSYRYVERPANSYNLIDTKINLSFKRLNFYGVLYNILNTEYQEKANIPMPKRNWMVGLNYIIE